MKSTTNTATFAAGLCAAILAAATASADTYFWAGQDGNWSDETKWTHDGVTGNGYPSAETDIVRFNANGASTINIDGNYTIREMTLNASSAGSPNTLTVVGSGKLKLVGTGDSTFTTLAVYANRKLVLAGAEVVPLYVQYIHDNAEIEVRAGAVFRPHYVYVHSTGSRLTMDGGQLLQVESADGGGGTVCVQNGWQAADAGNVGFFDMKSGYMKAQIVVKSGTFTMTGGTLEALNTTMLPFSDYAEVSFTGGEMHLKTTKDHPITRRGVFPNGATLVLGAGTVLSNLVTGATDPELKLDGGTVCGGGVFKASEDFAITGGGDLTFGGGMNLSPREDDPISNVVFDVDSITLGANLSRPYNPETGMGNAIGTNLHMHLPRPITLAATNANWFVSGFKTTMYVEKGLTVDTTDRKDGATARKITLRKPKFSHGAYLRTIGCGEVALETSDLASDRLSEISVGGTSTLGFSLRWDRWLSSDYLSIASGATLNMPLRDYLPFDADTVSFAPGSRVYLSGNGGAGVFQPLLLAGPESIASLMSGGTLPEVVLADSSTWTNEFINGSLVVWKKSVTPASATFTANRWTGATDGTFETDGNWSSGAAPADTNVTAVFDGIANTHVTVGSSVPELYSLRFLPEAGPFILDGGKIKLESRNMNGINATIYSASPFPVIIRNNIERANNSGNHAAIGVNSGGWGYISLEGDVAAYARLDVRGDVRIRGTVTAMNLRFYSSDAVKPTRLTVCDGGTMTFSNQTLAHEGPRGGMWIKSGGKITIANHSGSVFWGYNMYGDSVPSVVDGLFDVQVPLGGSVGHWYTGSGRVKMKDTGSSATADYTIRLGGSVKFSAETFVKPITVEETPTLCSENAWTYAAGALDLPKGSELTIDTQDPDNAVGYDCTFASPITGEGALKVKGAGSLTLTAENSIGGGVTLAGGTLVYTAPQTFGPLSGTGTLSVSAVGGSVPALTVAGDADLSGVTIGGDSLSELGAAGWITLATFPAGASVTGEPTMPSGEWRTRIVSNGDGTKSLQGRLRTGIMLIVR